MTYNKQDIIDFLDEHDQALRDALDFFEVNDLEDVSSIELVSWLREHNQLYTDFNMSNPERELSLYDIDYIEIQGRNYGYDLDIDGDNLYLSKGNGDENPSIHAKADYNSSSLHVAMVLPEEINNNFKEFADSVRRCADLCNKLAEYELDEE